MRSCTAKLPEDCLRSATAMRSGCATSKAAIAAGHSTQRRAELLWERPNPVTDGATDDARRRGGAESRHDGKHVGVQGQASACPLRGLVPRPSGTAVYNAPGAVAPQRKREANPHGRRNGVKPVRTVVWDPWLALVVSHGDPIFLLCFGGNSSPGSGSESGTRARRLSKSLRLARSARCRR